VYKKITTKKISINFAGGHKIKTFSILNEESVIRKTI